MGRGGVLCFDGSPKEALKFFGAKEHAAIYAALDRRPADDWRSDFLRQRRDEGDTAEKAAPPDRPAQAPKRNGIQQVRILGARYLRLVLRDRRNLAILLGQAPLMALALIGLFAVDVFSAEGDAGAAAQLLFLLITTVIWLGSIDSARELIKERAIFVREAAIGVTTGSYLASKVLVLFGLAMIQVALVLTIVLFFRPLHEGASVYLGLAAALLLTCFIAVAMGLVVSAVVNSEDQAVSFVPLVLIPQLFFAGAIIPLKEMSEPVAALSSAVFAKWSYQVIGTVVDLNARFARSPGGLEQYGSVFFDVRLHVGYGVLVGFVAVFVVATWRLLEANSSKQPVQLRGRRGADWRAQASR